MPRRERSRSPDQPYKKVRSSARSSRSPSPTRRYHQRDRTRYVDDDQRRPSHRRDHDRRATDHHRRDRSHSRDRRPPEKQPPTPSVVPSTPPVEDEKLKAKRERLEAWKREREAKKSLDDAKAKAMALAGKPLLVKEISKKPSVQLNRSALPNLGLRKGLPIKPELIVKNSTAVMDDQTETTRKLEVLGEMPAVDMSMVEGQESVGENLEVDDDDEEANKLDLDQKAMDEDEELDPLDAFMSGVKEEVKKVNAEDRIKVSTNTGGTKSTLAQRLDDDENEVEEPDNVNPDNEVDLTELNPEDILALAAKKAKKKDVALVDHSKVSYEPFRKEFYHPPPEIQEMSEEEADLLRLELDGIKIRGVDCPKPIVRWSHCGLPSSCLDVIKRLNFTAPTSIQSQAIPAIMSGRDIIGVAKTGSGKTMAFLLPLFRHIKDQRPLEQMEGPIAIIMTPTRELAVQIHRDCKPFLKVLNLRAVCAYGGSPIKDQIAEMKKGAEIIVCTPGRMIDLLTANSGRVTNLKRITYLVLDEADRMFDMGFEPQVMKIINNIRPDRQTVLFSATFPKQMDSLARKILLKPLEITVGGRSVVAPEIEQIVEVRPEDTKFTRLLEILGQIYNEDQESRTLIFVDRQEAADNLLRELMRKGYMCMSLHGGKDQVDRDATITDFKAGVVPILIATSVAARGLDVKQLKLVINYDAPNHMEDYVHRAGRTGRAGNKGTCVTFITPDQERYSVDLYRALKASSANVPQELSDLANGFLAKVKSGNAKVAGSGFGGKGLDRLDQERDAKEKAERKAYGEGEDGPEKTEEGTAVGATTTKGAAATPEEDSMTFGKFKVEIKKGRAPDSSMGGTSVADAARLVRLNKIKSDEAVLQKAMKDAEEVATKSGRNGSAYKTAQSAVAKIKAQIQATKLYLQQGTGGAEDSSRKKDADTSEFHAIVPINDYPQKARWKVTNKETMSQLIEETGASVTNKGIYYEANKEPGPEAPPKLHLLVESNDEMKVEHAVREIKRLLIEASTSAIQAELRNPTAAPGRYSVV